MTIHIAIAGAAWLAVFTTLVWSAYAADRRRTDHATNPAGSAPLRPPPPTPPTCATVGCDRYAYWLWHAADLRTRLLVCGPCAYQNTVTRGGFTQLTTTNRRTR